MTKENDDEVCRKVERDQALNMRELMAFTGYGRAAIKRMNLPFVCGKIPYSDFRRFLRRLQNKTLATQQLFAPPPASPQPVIRQAPTAQLQALVDRMLAPRAPRTR